MFKRILNSLHIPLPSARSEQEKKPDDTVNIHAMWHQKDPYRRVTSSDQNFQKKLISAYIELADATCDLPRNVHAHLWTDRKSLHALYMPSGEIEIPHSMLARMPVGVHLDQELDVLIEQVADQETRSMLRELRRHPGEANIGFRSDVARALYCLLYSAKEKNTSDAEGKELNIHLDVDTLAAIREMKTQLHEGWRRKKIVNSGGLESTKAALFLMGRKVRNLPLPPKPDALSSQEVTALAAQPQRNWSAPAASPDSAGEKVVIPEQLQKMGHLTCDGANDAIGMVPGHPKALAVAKDIHDGLKNWEYNTKRAGRYDKNVHKSALALHNLNPAHNGNPATLDRHQVLDYFRLAERIADMKPEFEQKILELKARVEDDAATADERRSAVMRAKAMRDIYGVSRMLMNEYVNHHSYYPQIRTTYRADDIRQAFSRFSKSVFGVTPPLVETGSWKGSGLDTACPGDVDRESAEFAEQMRLAFAEIRNMLRARADDDIGIDYFGRYASTAGNQDAPREADQSQPDRAERDTGAPGGVRRAAAKLKSFLRQAGSGGKNVSQAPASGSSLPTLDREGRNASPVPRPSRGGITEPAPDLRLPGLDESIDAWLDSALKEILAAGTDKTGS